MSTELLPQHKIFADEWLTGAATGKRFNGRAAATYAGFSESPSNPYANASMVLNRPDVQAYVKEQLEEHTMSVAEILMRFTAVARSEVGDVVKVGPHGQLAIDPDAVVSNKHFIKQFGFDSNGNPKIEFHDAVAALRDLAKIKGLMKEGFELTGPGGSPATLTVSFVMPDGSEFKPEPETEES